MVKIDCHFYQQVHKVWVQSYDIPPDECVVLVNQRVRRHACVDTKLPFLCEKDALVLVTLTDWLYEPLGVAALTISTITAFFTLVCVACWLLKSKHRHNEKLQRRN